MKDCIRCQQKSLKWLRFVRQVHAEFTITKNTHTRQLLFKTVVDKYFLCMQYGSQEIVTKEFLVKMQMMFLTGHMFVSHTMGQQV
jgi:hypothetical protein